MTYLVTLMPENGTKEMAGRQCRVDGAGREGHSNSCLWSCGNDLSALGNSFRVPWRIPIMTLLRVTVR